MSSRWGGIYFRDRRKVFHTFDSVLRQKSWDTSGSSFDKNPSVFLEIRFRPGGGVPLCQFTANSQPILRRCSPRTRCTCARAHTAPPSHTRNRSSPLMRLSVRDELRSHTPRAIPLILAARCWLLHVDVETLQAPFSLQPRVVPYLHAAEYTRCLSLCSFLLSAG